MVDRSLWWTKRTLDVAYVMLSYHWTRSLRSLIFLFLQSSYIDFLIISSAQIIHLVRHFNAWHPSVHRCAGTWPHSVRLTGPGNPLTNQVRLYIWCVFSINCENRIIHNIFFHNPEKKFSRIFGVSLIQLLSILQDFSIVDVSLEAPEALQCIWWEDDQSMWWEPWSVCVSPSIWSYCLFRCGMFMDRTMLAMHFHEVHPDDVEVPKCHLCLQVDWIRMRISLNGNHSEKN